MGAKSSKLNIGNETSEEVNSINQDTPGQNLTQDAQRAVDADEDEGSGSDFSSSEEGVEGDQPIADLKSMKPGLIPFTYVPMDNSLAENIYQKCLVCGWLFRRQHFDTTDVFRWCALFDNHIFEFENELGELVLKEKINLKGGFCFENEESPNSFVVHTGGFYIPTAAGVAINKIIYTSDGKDEKLIHDWVKGIALASIMQLMLEEKKIPQIEDLANNNPMAEFLQNLKDALSKSNDVELEKLDLSLSAPSNLNEQKLAEVQEADTQKPRPDLSTKEAYKSSAVEKNEVGVSSAKVSAAESVSMEQSTPQQEAANEAKQSNRWMTRHGSDDLSKAVTIDSAGLQENATILGPTHLSGVEKAIESVMLKAMSSESESVAKAVVSLSQSKPSAEWMARQGSGALSEDIAVASEISSVPSIVHAAPDYAVGNREIAEPAPNSSVQQGASESTAAESKTQSKRKAKWLARHGSATDNIAGKNEEAKKSSKSENK